MKDLLLSPALFGPAAGLVVLLALAAPFQTLLMLDLALVFLPGQWLVGGVRVDPGDLVIGGLVLAVVLRGRLGGRRSLPPPGATALWLALGVALCAAYVAAPINQDILNGPARICYQLYRYCWKPILYFPLVALLLGKAPRAWMVLDAVLVGGDVCAALGLREGFQGLRSQGPFDSPNTLGALLVVPMLIAAAGLISEHRRWRKAAYLASLLLLGRVMLYSGSRGALMAVCVGTAMLLWQAVRREPGRRRLLRLAPWVLAAAALAVAARPGLLHGPNVQRFLTIAHPMDEDTFQWRMKERWPHFWAMVEAHPWLGTGSYVDLSLGQTGNTPHNGYIAIAVMSGLPALGLYLGLGVLAIFQTLRRLKRSRRRVPLALAAAGGDRAAGPPGTDRLLDALTAAALAALMVHNFDDTVILLPAVGKELWLLIGLALAPPRLATAVAAAAAGSVDAAGSVEAAGPAGSVASVGPDPAAAAAGPEVRGPRRRPAAPAAAATAARPAAVPFTPRRQTAGRPQSGGGGFKGSVRR
ncbi:MAG TPA: O-antigen ligase family protein [Thermoanaerobaculia bacterium]|nr:O-antigen ligase family protein [Thermoanaerobaculia bacterium]